MTLWVLAIGFGHLIVEDMGARPERLIPKEPLHYIVAAVYILICADYLYQKLKKKSRFLPGVLYSLGHAWLSVSISLMVTCYLMIGLSQGFTRVAEILSPFNLWNVLVTILLLLPGLGAIWISNRLEKPR